ncbi:esterase-like activity of phytase family protein [Chelatococcus asaccharovorans]|uniref:Phytase-like protein with esterase activity n=1 Tax=Chelatococcus asaccharovorans TaxID=28210 RepID=A0A2V3U6K6_9HYPH|nr:esterase-like activity of phytase family protein [Chelatococcus asaccharovorans]MBS7704137.1 esterase-like activity of phytase family protein [Chelatococcus asaccharovorans]PXW53237.1 phytase-like protein with esterase activity [Chelatococcus asaccharovorans]
MRRITSTSAFAALLLASTSLTAAAEPVFNRIASFPVVANLPGDRDAAKPTVAEIVTVSEDGNLLVYTDSPQEGVGFIDITDASAPKPAGFVPLKGEPTSVTIVGGKALIAVVTSKDKANPAGELVVLDLARKAIDKVCDLGGQPDSVAASRDKKFLAVVIENERDEDKDKGKIPQLPGGNLTVLPLAADGVDCAGKKVVDLTGLSAIAPEDPEPEFVDINGRNEAIVSLQENNHLAIVDLASGKVVKHFPAGVVTLDKVDAKRDGVIALNGRIEGVKREPDTVQWIDDERFLTANEGDYQGGSRGFTIFNRDGRVEYDSGNLLEHLAVRLGHFPEKRASAKGVEPEGGEVATFGDDKLIFIASERGSVVFVFRDKGPGQAPEYLQTLPSGVAPEGVLAIPGRDLLVTANEADNVKDGGPRSHVVLYKRAEGTPNYPTIVSVDGADGLPLPWGALSGLTTDGKTPGRLFTVTDSFYGNTRILEIDASAKPARIIKATPVTRDGKAASYDGEGIAFRRNGGFWIVSEGNPEKKDNPTANQLVSIAPDGSVEEEIALPDALAKHATRFGFEGVTVTGEGADETVWIAVQREWKDDPKGKAKILSYKPATKTWGVLHYPLESIANGWVGLSEITAVGDGTFVVVERDNQLGDKALKALRSFSVKGLTPAAPGAEAIPTVTKSLVRDLAPDLAAPKGYVLDKVESFVIDAAGNAFIVTDNDGVDGSSGETQFIPLGKLAIR